jgi:hypothetical protein
MDMNLVKREYHLPEALLKEMELFQFPSLQNYDSVVAAALFLYMLPDIDTDLRETLHKLAYSPNICRAKVIGCQALRKSMFNKGIRAVEISPPSSRNIEKIGLFARIKRCLGLKDA